MSKDRVILVKGDKSNWYEQAIFIVKGGVSQTSMPVDLVAEAEKIIHSYNNKGFSAYKPYVHAAAPTLPAPAPVPVTRQEKVKKKASAFDLFFNAAMLISCAILAGVLMYSFIQ